MTASPRFNGVAPVLLTSDLARASDFYTQHLGFSMVSMYGDYLILRRDDVWLHFSLVPDLDSKANQCSVYLYVTGVTALYEACKAEGILRHNAWLGVRKYGMRDFSVIDLDGNLLTFGERIERRTDE